MNTGLHMWMEIVFNLAYLAAIWALVGAMAARRHRLTAEARRIAEPLWLAFALLAGGIRGMSVSGCAPSRWATWRRGSPPSVNRWPWWGLAPWPRPSR
jgi:hypothetical protein